MKPRAVGERIGWHDHRGTATLVTGVVVERDETDRHDELMGREPGEGLRLFGALLRARCDDEGCTACKGGWRPGWLHGVSESQALDAPAREATLFDLLDAL